MTISSEIPNHLKIFKIILKTIQPNGKKIGFVDGRYL